MTRLSSPERTIEQRGTVLPARVERLERLAFAVAVAAGAAVFALYLGLWAGLILSGGTIASDFTPFYTGWTIAARGDGAQLYDAALQADVQRELLGGRQFEAGLAPFANPPHLVLPFLPFTALPLEAGYLAWGVVQVALLTWLAFRLVTRVGASWDRRERVLLVAGALAAPPLLLTLLQGAFSLVITVAVVETYLALRDRRDRRAGVWLFVASLKPQAVVTLGVAVLVARRGRTVAVAGVLGVAAAAAATAAFGPGIWAAYLQFIGHYVGSFDEMSVRPSVMWNVRGTVALLLGGTPGASVFPLVNALATAAQLGAVAATMWIWRGSWRCEDVSRFDLRFSATIVLGLLASPHANPHDGLLLVAAAAIAYRALRDGPHGHVVGVAMFLAPFVILAGNSLSANEVGGPPVRVPVVLMCALLVTACLALARPVPAPLRANS